MFAAPASHHPHQQRPHHANAQPSHAAPPQQQPQPQQSLPPPSLREILDAFGKDGNGDRDMLMSILASKRAEEERIASQLNYQTQLFLLAQQYQALQAHALVAQQQAAAVRQRIALGESAPSPTSDQPLPSPSLSQYSEGSSSSSSHRYSPYARSSGGSDSLAVDGQQFRSEKQARVNSTLKARRARGSSSASSSSSVANGNNANGTVLGPLASPAKSTASVRDTSMSPPPAPSPSSSSAASVTKRAPLSELLGATSAAYAVRDTAVQESFLRGGEDVANE